MKKRGFTLIELLAVIIILAIIALIATPIVMNIINTTRKEAAERAVSNLEHAADIYYYQNGGNITFYCNDGVCSNGEKKLEIDGKGPEDGIIKISKEGDIALNSIIINKHICYKDGESYKCEKANKINETTTNGVLTLNESKTTILSNYIIKGNSYQTTRSGKNLFSISNLEETSYKGLNYEVDNGTVRINGTQTGSFERSIPCHFILKANTNYSISSNLTGTITGNLPLFYFSADTTPSPKKDIFITNKASYKYNFTVTEDTEINYFIIQSSVADTVWENVELKIQVEEGITATAYELYGKMPSSEYPSEIQSVGDLVTEEGPNKGKYEIPIKVTGEENFVYSIYLDEPLRCLGNACDYIDYESGQVVRNIKEYVETGETRKWSANLDHGVFSDTTYIIYLDDLKWDESSYGDVISTHFKDVKNAHAQGMSLGRYANVIYINWGAATTTEELQAWFKEQHDSGNPVKINYVLTTPQYEKLDLPEININKGTSNITIDTSIKPSEFIVDYYK